MIQWQGSKSDLNLLNSLKGFATDTEKSQSPSYINAFQLIAMSNDLDLSGLFEEKVNSWNFHP